MDQKIVQVTPFLRRGIVSSVLPFPTASPHGLTVDNMVQGGSSGSPVFEPGSGEVIGMVWGGFENTNFTFVVPGHLIAKALEGYLRAFPPDTGGTPTLDDLLATGGTEQLEYEAFLVDPETTGT